MRFTLKVGLIGLNVALLGVLAVVTLQPGAQASAGATGGQPTRPRGQYVMVSGRIQGGNSNAVYVLDVTNQELIAVRWDASGQRLLGVGYRSVSTDLAGEGGAR